jgi:DNA-binding NarL/FixJ family response regulator
MYSNRRVVTLAREGLSVIRAPIVDEQDEVRRGLQMRLAIEPDMTVVGETGGVGEALHLAQAVNPDAIVADIGIGARDAGGVTLVKRPRAAAPAPAVVVLTPYADKSTRALAEEAGAQAFLEKCGEAAELLEAIRQLAPRQPPRIDRAATGPLAAQ